MAGHPDAGKIIAKGVISGGTDAESVTGPLLECANYFTDIRIATRLFGGDIKKRKIG
ncbi:hypothetical protein [Nonomuraea sp. NPDC003804]|uniref:hypothetical protein n=1 Tax=Nonomuraea sp. NPDC003804 TaxID=3154547 RepID=UPI0033BD56F1